MSTFRNAFVLAFGLMLSASAVQGEAAVDPPRVTKPKPAPPLTPQEILDLPPAVFDPTLAIGGEDLKAKKVETRLTVQVHVNDRGPYNFIVDSGADTWVVGLRIARDLQLPLGTPVILNAMTARHIVDRVRVDRLSLGTTTYRNMSSSMGN